MNISVLIISFKSSHLLEKIISFIPANYEVLVIENSLNQKVKKLEKLKIQIEKLEAIGGSSSIVPSEGLVFKYKGDIYKFTGAFAPVNQILGSLKF